MANIFKETIRHWGAILTVAGVFLGIASTSGIRALPQLPSALYLVCFELFFSALAWLCLALLINYIVGSFVGECTYDVRPIKRGELESLLPFYEEIIGDERPAINQIKAIFNINKKSILILEKITRLRLSTKSSIVGFYSIFPLTKEAANLFEREQISVLQMSRDHICTPRQPYHALYVGSVGGKGGKARAHILAYLLGQIDDCANHGARFVYARPVTKSGLRLAKQYSFEAVDKAAGPTELRRVYKLKLPRQGRRVAQIRPA